MESKEELYHHGLNPNYLETFNEEECIRVLFALESIRIPYTRIPHLDHEKKSLRFYVMDQPSLDMLRKCLADAPDEAGQEAHSKYALVYENSFV